VLHKARRSVTASNSTPFLPDTSTSCYAGRLTPPSGVCQSHYNELGHRPIVKRIISRLNSVLSGCWGCSERRCLPPLPWARWQRVVACLTAMLTAGSQWFRILPPSAQRLKSLFLGKLAASGLRVKGNRYHGIPYATMFSGLDMR